MEERQKLFVGVMMTILDERQRRIFLGTYSQCLGHGSIKELHTRHSFSSRDVKMEQN